MDTESTTFPSKDRFTIWDPNPSLFTLWTRMGEPLPCRGSDSSLKHPQWTTHYRIPQHYWIIIGDSTRFPLFTAKSVKKPLQVWVSARLSANPITFNVPLLQPAWTAHMNTYTCNRHLCQQGCKLVSFSSTVRTPQPRKTLLANTQLNTPGRYLRNKHTEFQGLQWTSAQSYRKLNSRQSPWPLSVYPKKIIKLHKQMMLMAT